MRLRAVLFLLLFLAFNSVAQQSVSSEIKKIQIFSDASLDVPRILGLLNIKEKSNFNQDELEEGLSRLAETGHFQNIRTSYESESSTLKLYLMVQNRIKAIEIHVEGTASRALKTQLQSEINDSLNITKDEPVFLDSLSEIRGRILARLKDRGYSKNQVLILLEERSAGPERVLVIRSNLGPRDEIRELILEGMNSQDANELSKILGLRSDILKWAHILGLPLGKEFTSGKTISIRAPLDYIFINESISKWSKAIREKGFYDLKIQTDYSLTEGGGYQLKISLNKGQRYRIQIKNTVAFWEKDLRAQIVEKSLRTENSLNLKEAREIIRKLYLSKGFKDVTIRTTSRDEENLRHVTFDIEEAKQFFLRKILLEGVSPQDQPVVEKAINAWKRSLMHPTHKIFWDEDFIKASLVDLIKEIRNLGYLAVRIIDFTPQYTASSPNVDVLLDLQLGARYTPRSVSVIGNTFLREAELNDIVTIQPGDWINPNEVNNILKNLESVYKDKGFLSVEASWDEAQMVKNAGISQEVDLELILKPGPQIKVGVIVIESSGRTKEGVILREANKKTLHPGGLWSQSGHDRLEQNLSGLGIFGQTKVTPVGGKTIQRSSSQEGDIEIQEKDLKISVTDRPGGAIEFGPGYRTDDGIIGVAEFNYRNLGGWNRSLLLRSQISAKLENYQFLEQRYSAAYMEPWLADIPLRFRVNAGYSKTDETVFFRGRKVSGYNTEEVNYGFGLDRAITEHLHWYHNLYSYSQPRIFGLEDNQESSKIPEEYKIASIGSTLIYERRNNIFNPSKGYMASSSVEYAAPFLGSDQDGHFFIFRQDLYTYIPMGPAVVAAFAFNYAKLWGLGNTRGVPLTKRLTLGGRTTIRSLPEGAIRNDASGVILQDSILTRAELRHALFLGLGFAYFVDMGQLDSHGFGYSGWRVGPGVGFRYLTPVGPISLDFAHNLNQREDEDTLKLQISIGAF